jgi:hypothetical protein
MKRSQTPREHKKMFTSEDSMEEAEEEIEHKL